MDKGRKSLLLRTPVPSEEEKQVDKGRKSLLLRTPVPSEEEKQVDKGRKALLVRTSVPSEEEKQVDKGRKALLLRGKVRGCIACSECNTPRCIYSHSKLTLSEVSEIPQIKNSKLYTCGSVLFPPGSSHENTIVREALVCVKNIKTQYYSSILVHFLPVCCYYGLERNHSWMRK